MACKDCGQQAARQEPCRTFTFPLGAGQVEVIVRGLVTRDDLNAGYDRSVDFVTSILRDTLPARVAEVSGG
jgi:hypothetical protein